jgi:hypothetical protein
MGVPIDMIWLQENLEISHQMAGHENHEYDSRNSHEELSPDGRTEEVTEKAHRVDD